MEFARRQVLSGLGAAVLAGEYSRLAAAQEFAAVNPQVTPTRISGIRSEDGLDISVQLYGQADARGFIFIHGLGQCHLSWVNQVFALSRHYRIATYDLRGHGGSSKPKESQFYSEGPRWASDLRAVVNASGIKCPILVGWSLGGVVLSHYLSTFSSRGWAALYSWGP
jgi:pimeloyl-ACP methyl ester carboxylesterase